MNEARAHSLAALSGLALAAAVALWWLGSTRLALDKGMDASRPAAEALHTLWLVRGMAVAVVSLRLGALRGWQAGAVAALGLIAPSWPLAVLAWSASTAPWSQVALSEVVLLAAGLALPLIGLGLRRAVRRADFAETVGTAVGIGLAASVWLTRGIGTLSFH